MPPGKSLYSQQPAMCNAIAGHTLQQSLNVPIPPLPCHSLLLGGCLWALTTRAQLKLDTGTALLAATNKPQKIQKHTKKGQKYTHFTQKPSNHLCVTHCSGRLPVGMTGCVGMKGAKCALMPIGPMPGPPPPCGMQKVLCRFKWHTSAPMWPGLVRPTYQKEAASSRQTRHTDTQTLKQTHSGSGPRYEATVF